MPPRASRSCTARLRRVSAGKNERYAVATIKFTMRQATNSCCADAKRRGKHAWCMTTRPLSSRPSQLMAPPRTAAG